MAARFRFRDQSPPEQPEAEPATGRSLVDGGLLYAGLLFAIAVPLIVWQAPQVQGNMAVLFLLIGLNVLAGLMPIVIYGDSYISVGLVITLTIIVLYGAPGAAIVGPLAVIGPGVRHGKLDRHLAFNAALFTVVDVAAAGAYELFAEVAPPTVSVSMALGVAAATGADFVTNAVLLAVWKFVSARQTVATFWSQHSWLAMQYVGLGIVGFALASAYVALGMLGIAAFVTPALMMRLTMKQYVDKTEESVEKLKVQNEQLQVANLEIRRVSDELRNSYDDTLEALVNALDARDQETKGHSLRVSRYMMDIAREMGVTEGTQEWVDMQRGSLLHDVGKIGVSDTILLKPGKLTDDEWRLMRLHPEIGYNMLRQVKFLEGASEIILEHHERWDGKGYPRGLGHEDILLGARIFSVVDTFDSMTSDRPYRKALSTMDALNEILRFSGSQFDPRVVEAFLDIYDIWVKERDELHGIANLAA